jgi:hypothetical protein
VTCDHCRCDAEQLFRAPLEMWPAKSICQWCVDDFVDDADSDYRNGPECEVCRDGFCNNCL